MPLNFKLGPRKSSPKPKNHHHCPNIAVKSTNSNLLRVHWFKRNAFLYPPGLTGERTETLPQLPPSLQTGIFSSIAEEMIKCFIYPFVWTSTTASLCQLPSSQTSINPSSKTFMWVTSFGLLMKRISPSPSLLTRIDLWIGNYASIISTNTKTTSPKHQTCSYRLSSIALEVLGMICEGPVWSSMAFSSSSFFDDGADSSMWRK